MTGQRALGRRAGMKPWLVLALATLPAIWYVLDFESDIDPEFPRCHPPHVQYVSGPGLPVRRGGRHDRPHRGVHRLRGDRAFCMGAIGQPAKRLWIAAMAVSLAGFWHAATPGPLLDGWYGLGWRTLYNPDAALAIRLTLAIALAVLAALLRLGPRRSAVARALEGLPASRALPVCSSPPPP